jgi:hypothetical protein
MLMYTISVEPQPRMKVNIHNLCQVFDLEYPKCFGIGANWDVMPAYWVNAGNMTSTGLIPSLATFECTLTYQLRRRDSMLNLASDYQPKLEHIRIFVIWKSEGYENFRVFVHLAEYGEWVDWNTTVLKEYRQTYISQLGTYTDPVEDTWLTSDGIVLMTRLELDLTQRNSVLNITISEGIRDKHTKKLIWLNPER